MAGDESSQAPGAHEDVVTARVPRHHFLLRTRDFFACVGSGGSLYGAHGTVCPRLAILVPLVHTGGLGSCTHSKTQKPPHPGGFRVFYPLASKSAEDGSALGFTNQGVPPMSRSSFDFDVITGPAPTRSAPKPEPKPASGPQKPPAEPGK